MDRKNCLHCLLTVLNRCDAWKKQLQSYSFAHRQQCSMSMKTIKLLFGIFTITASLAVQGQSQSFLTNGLVAYYPFIGNANDASGNGNNGTVQGATLTTDRFNNPNSAYYFNGSSWIETSQYRLLDKAKTATISVWMAFNAGGGQPLSAGDRRAGIDAISMRFGDQAADGVAFDDCLAPQTHTSTIGLGANPYFSPHPLPNFTANTWHQIVVVLNTNNPLGTFAIYVDGAQGYYQVGSDDGATAFTNISYDRDMRFLIGAIEGRPIYPTPQQFFFGKIDDIRIYNRALSSNEVTQLYAIESTTSPRTATGTATLTGSFVTSVSITDSGYGYTNTPMVRFIGGGGSGAQAVAVVSNGVVTAINVFNAGYGYTNAPLVVIEPPFIPSPSLGIAPMSFLTFSNLTVSGSYQLQQSAGWYWTNQPLNFTATGSIYTQMFAGIVGSGDYRLALNPVPNQAFATA